MARVRQSTDIRSNALDKQSEAQKRSKVYSTERINQITKDTANGGSPDMDPFWHGQTDYRDQGIAFEYTDEELEELERCSTDIIYFVENYCKFLNDKGRTLVKLRDYQKRNLLLLAGEKYDPVSDTIIPRISKLCIMASRQTGKCITGNMQLDITDPLSGNPASAPIYELFYRNMQHPTALDTAIYYAHKYNFPVQLISALYHQKYGKDFREKIIDSIQFDEPIKIKTADGYNTATAVHITKPYHVYKITLENGDTLKCADKHKVFVSDVNSEYWCYAYMLTVRHYVKTTSGWSRVKQVKAYKTKEFMFDVSIKESTHAYFANNILSHNTTTTGAYLTWMVCFHTDKNVLVTANKGSTGEEILSKIKEFLENLPFFMKPGVVNLRKNRIKLENGCSIKTAAASKTPATGDSIQILYMDEVAHIPANIVDDYWASVEPTMSSFRGSQVIMSSTPKGKGNLFHTIYTNAVPYNSPDVEQAIKDKKFISSRVDWFEVPGRDEEWERHQRADLGDEIFDREYGLSFETAASRLISSWYVLFMHRIEQQFRSIPFYKVPESISSKIIWHPSFHPDQLTYYDLLQLRLLFTVDTALGREKASSKSQNTDYNIINIFQIQTLSPCKIEENRNYSKPIAVGDVIQYKQVGIYIDRFKDEVECAEAAKYLTFNIFKSGYKDLDNVRILVELNFNGTNWINKFKTHPSFYEQVLVRTEAGVTIDGKPRTQIGYRTSIGTHGKNYFCELGAKMMDRRQIIISQWDPDENQGSIQQLTQFGKNAKGRYECSSCHDDIAITSLFVSIAHEQPTFMMWVEEWLEQLPYTPQIAAIRRMLELYVEEETDVSDEEFKRFFDAASAGFGKITRQQNGYSGKLANFSGNGNQRTSQGLGGIRTGIMPSMNRGGMSHSPGSYNQYKHRQTIHR